MWCGVRSVFLTCVCITIAKSGRNDNEVVADPEIICKENSVGIAVLTKHAFSGRIFVNGLSEVGECVQFFTNSSSTRGQFEIPFGTCDMRAKRVVTSKQSAMEYSTTVVISFHTVLLTYTDRAFSIQCLYQQRMDQWMGTFFEVSVMPSVMLTSSFPVPNCQYTLHSGGTDGPEAQFTRIGDPIVHKWQCDSDMYRMMVKNCFVDDGRKTQYQLIDDVGCVIDPVVIPDIIYEPALKRAYVLTQAFKFADRAHVTFRCQLALCLKGDANCTVFEPTVCKKSRSKREVNNGNILPKIDADQSSNHNSFDIISQPLIVLDIADEQKFQAYVNESRRNSRDFCVNIYGFSVLIFCNIFTLMAGTVFLFAFLRRRRAPRKIT